MLHARRRPVLAVLLAGLAGTAATALPPGAIAAQAQPVPVTTTRFADLAMIDLAVAQFTGRAIGVPGGAAQPVDRRLRLASCRSPLMVAWRAGAMGTLRDSVMVRCPDGAGWRVYVPVVQALPADPGAPAGQPAIQRGEAVSIAMVGDGFSVEQNGEALDAGPVGGWIRVRTGAKADALRGRIVRPGQVEVPVD